MTRRLWRLGARRVGERGARTGLSGPHDTSAPPWRQVDWSRHTHNTTIAARDLSYVDIGTGPTVVLLHGLGMSWRAWLPVLVDLAGDHRVIAVDLPGFGSSQRLPWRRDLNGYAESVVGLLHQLEILPCTVVGHSLGGLVAQRVAVQHGRALTALVLVCSPDSRMGLLRRAGIMVSLTLLRTLSYSARVEQWLVTRKWLHRTLFGGLVADVSCLHPELIAQLSGGYGTNGFWRAMHAALLDPISLRVNEIGVPTLVLAGAEDAIVPPSVARQLAASIGHAHLHAWRRVGHAPMIERPAEFGLLVRNFVAGLDAGIAASG